MENFLKSLDKIFDAIEEHGVSYVFTEDDLIVICLSNFTWRCIYTNDKTVHSAFLSLKSNLK